MSLPIWYLALAAWLTIIALACLLTGRAVEVSISGHSSGTGLHTLYFAGDLINASIVQGNNSTWLINATGAA